MNGLEQLGDEELLQQALRWQAASTRDDCDWQAFTDWLETSPRHRQAYDEIARLDDHVARHAAALRIAPLPQRPPRARGRLILAAAVAGVALLGAVAWRTLPAILGQGPRTFVAQAAGSTLTLAGGVKVVLAPGSSLVVAGRHDAQLRLDGDAWFEVPHVPGRELRIAAGDYELRDIGTRFEVVSDGAQLKVAVTEGELAVSLPGRDEPAHVGAGQRLLVAGDPPMAEYGAVAAADVAGWREGRLVFRNEPLSLVAVQLGRHAGLTVTVDPSVAQRRFSGVFTIGDGSQLLAQLARIMDLRAQRDGAAVRLLAAGTGPAGL
ncbi:MAG TPA: FecR domain-containing protein [Steroidobacteraceae bacterium]|nr:FecR domain-containing protein [Steroidobacteraceae bacterium]